MRIILRTIRIYIWILNLTRSAPKCKSEVLNRWRLRQSAKVKCKSDVFVRRGALSTGYPQVCAQGGPKATFVPYYAKRKVSEYLLSLRGNKKPAFAGSVVRTKVLLVF